MVYQPLWISLWRTPVVGVALVGVALIVGLGEAFGYLRGSIAVAFALGTIVFGIRFFHFVMAAPPDPDVADVSGYGLRYVCSMCGLELSVEVAAKDRAPSHCMEPMVLVQK